MKGIIKGTKKIDMQGRNHERNCQSHEGAEARNAGMLEQIDNAFIEVNTRVKDLEAKVDAIDSNLRAEMESMKK